MRDLSIFTITDFGANFAPFLCRNRELAESLDATYVEHDGTNAVVMEPLLESALAQCPDDGWILELHHDETCTPEMESWLRAGEYRASDHWAFPRLNFWPDTSSVVMYPDLQTRLSVKAMSGRRTRMHQGSPFGTGRVAPVAIEHHKLIVVPVGERRAQLEQREALQPGAGVNFREFLVPEDVPGIQTISVAAIAA